MLLRLLLLGSAMLLCLLLTRALPKSFLLLVPREPALRGCLWYRRRGQLPDWYWHRVWSRTRPLVAGMCWWQVRLVRHWRKAGGGSMPGGRVCAGLTNLLGRSRIYADQTKSQSHLLTCMRPTAPLKIGFWLTCIIPSYTPPSPLFNLEKTDLCSQAFFQELANINAPSCHLAFIELVCVSGSNVKTPHAAGK